MKKLLLIIGFYAIQASLLSLFAQEAPSYGSLPPIHVDGNYLRDEAGNKVVLHGFMDTPSPYFNNNRWGNSATDGNVSSCVTYFSRIFKATTNNAQGAYCNLFRLHLDPCWTNDNNVKNAGFTQSGGKTYDPLGQEVSGEANTYHYSGAKLTKYLRTLYWRIAQASLKTGMYVIMRPPGVCPGTIKVGTYYQDYLIDVWDRVTKNDSILKYYGHIGLELANEPVSMQSASGSTSDDKRMHDFFQPIVDKIRENGFKGIIWIPGGTWQQEYRPYAKYPITDPLNNIGYAVHDYPGWYGLSDNSYNADHGKMCFGRSIPMIGTSPIVITEIDWSPENQSSGHYNEGGQWVPGNYGTWATATTSKWGNAFKKVKDYYGNVSMTLSGSGCYYDWDTYKSSNYKTVIPAFTKAMEANGLDPKEACGATCFDWYEEYSKVNYPSFERYQNEEYPENPFELSNEWFDPLIYNPINDNGTGNTAKHASAMSTLSILKGGYEGWRFDNVEGIDLSGYQSLKITFAKAPSKNTFIRIYDNSCNMNFAGRFYKLAVSGSKEFTIDLHNMEAFDFASKSNVEGVTIDPAHIRMVCIGTEGTDQIVYVKSVVLEGNETDGIADVNAQPFGTPYYYNANGIKLDAPQKGVNIVKYSNGKTKKVIVK